MPVHDDNAKDLSVVRAPQAHPEAAPIATSWPHRRTRTEFFNRIDLMLTFAAGLSVADRSGDSTRVGIGKELGPIKLFQA
jgi:hypothetical protein